MGTKTGFLRTRAGIALVAVAGILTLAALFMMNYGSFPVSEDGVPNPFSENGSSLKGQITQTPTRGGRVIYTVSYDNGEISENLMPGQTHFILTPDETTVSDGAELALAITPGKKIYGYKYTSRAATVEMQKQAELDLGDPVEYKDRFPGVFFASDEQRADTATFNIPAWEALKEVTFVPLSDVTLKKNARYVVIVPSAGVSFTARGLAWCGNEITEWENGEDCDDGNLISGDGCSGTDHPNGACTIEICGDSYLSPNGTPIEECDDGSICMGGPNDGQSCTAAAGGALGEIQCPQGNCTPQSFDGCQSNCLFEICGNASFEPAGLDGEIGTADDEQCDAGGICSLAGHDCLTSAAADVCRQQGGTCTPVASQRCTDTCQPRPNPWHNATIPEDVNGLPKPGSSTIWVTLEDYNDLISFINQNGNNTPVDHAVTPSPRYPDVNGDWFVTPADVNALVSWMMGQCGINGLQTEIGEVCDNGAANGTTCVPGYDQTCDWCHTDCRGTTTETGPYCGDGVLQENEGEQCDLGNDCSSGNPCNDGTTCTATCRTVSLPF